ncbi:unnamed protein product [Phytomonas sp. Hart1]|nr:unnamed protein product [Phytomonas sp. Hart1]|eukprot:CCW69986.1 unnamed protein product [Phytomonas sp. isolate Hart1]
MKRNLWGLAVWRTKPPEGTAQLRQNVTNFYRIGSISKRANDSHFDECHAAVVGNKRSENKIQPKGFLGGFCEENSISNTPKDLVFKKK